MKWGDEEYQRRVAHINFTRGVLLGAIIVFTLLFYILQSGVACGS